MSKLLRLAVVALFTLIPALAHQRIEVGNYLLICGMRNEPSYTGMRSGLDLMIRTKDGTPVEKAEKGLTIELISPTGTKYTYVGDGQYGSKSFWEAHGEKGRYQSDWVLLTPGLWKVRVFGQIGETPIDVTFDSPSTFTVKDGKMLELR
ncbi:MAG: hypothetical protein C4328_11260 [Meiothermus sp.]